MKRPNPYIYYGPDRVEVVQGFFQSFEPADYELDWFSLKGKAGIEVAPILRLGSPLVKPMTIEVYRCPGLEDFAYFVEVTLAGELLFYFLPQRHDLFVFLKDIQPVLLMLE